MSGYYTYVLSSLPMLHFQAKPPFALEDFFNRCTGLVHSDDLGMMQDALDPQQYGIRTKPAAVYEWFSFECSLRNELAALRSHQKDFDQEKYLRGDFKNNFDVMRIAQQAHKQESPLEAEKILDHARWNFLDALSLGRYFDQAALLVYALKLKINIRWQAIKEADGAHIIDTALTGPQGQQQQGQ